METTTLPPTPRANEAEADTLSLSALQAGDRFTALYVAVKECVDRGADTTKPRLSLVVADATCPTGRTAKVWTPDAATQAALIPGQVACLTGSVDTRAPWAGQLTIEHAVAVPQPDDLTPYLAPLPADHKTVWRTFCALVASVEQPFLKALLKTLLPPETQARFARAVAAMRNHHAFRGGLLYHTVEVARLCDQACDVLPFLRRDLLVTAALLHDLGKLDEMDHGLCAGSYTVLGTLVGHLHDGALQVRSAAQTIPGFPEPLRLALEHLILSHHGTPEHGSAKTPAFPEALVLSLCDQLSAHATAMHAAIVAAPKGQQTVRLGDHGWVFTGDLGDTPRSRPQQKAPVAPAPPTATNNFAIARSIPVRGLVAAGIGEESAELEGESLVVVPPQDGADFLVRVTGDSLQDAGVDSGDLLFVRQQAQAQVGQLVIAWVPGRGTVVKRLQKDCLASANANYPSIPLTDEVRLQGIVTGLLKQF